MSDRLKGKAILIAGGTTGIGLSAAMACVREHARVVAVGKDDEYLAAAQCSLGSESYILASDLSQAGAAEEVIAFAVAKLGPLDGVYHVAGASGRRKGDGPLHTITDEGWSYTLQQNLTSLFESTRAATRHFLEQGKGGSVLNIGSVLAEYPSPGHFATHAYAAAKAAVIGLTKSCAAYYAPYCIRFNVLAPGLVETPMSSRAASDPEIMRFIANKQPLDGARIGHPEDLDGAVIYFLSDESRFVTGQVMHVDGGWSVTDQSRPTGKRADPS